MTEEQAVEMLKRIVSAVDYDVYSDIFVNPEEECDVQDLVDELLSIVAQFVPVEMKDETEHLGYGVQEPVRHEDEPED